LLTRGGINRRWCFYINLPIGGLSGAILLLFFTAPSAAKPVQATLREKLLQMDPIGTALVMGGIIDYILALQYAGVAYAWNSSIVIGLIVGFVAIAAAFGAWEFFQGERAMMAPRLLKMRHVWVGGIFAMFLAGSYFLIIYYLPIYFQSIDGTTPTDSGVRNLPLIIAVTIATIASGASISANGHATPLLVVGTAVATIAAGLLYTLDIGTGMDKWIGYQVLGGLGYGLVFQIPMIMAQAKSTAEDLAATTAIIMCKLLPPLVAHVKTKGWWLTLVTTVFQTVGGALFVAAAQSAFVNTLIRWVATTAPGVPPQLLIFTGATELRNVFGPDVLPGVLVAYMQGLKVAFAVCIAGTGVAALLSPLMPWGRLNTEAVKSGGAA
jgi:MFS transporter, DHA2 family, glioxin efflux transporter